MTKTHFFPDNFDCSDSVMQIAVAKLTSLEAFAEELPVYIIHDVRDFSVVYMSPKGLRLLGSSLNDVRGLGQDYYTNFFNHEDVEFYLPKFREHLQSCSQSEWFTFFQQVATGQDQSFEWYLSAARPFVHDHTGKPLLSLTFALQLNPDHHLTEKAERLMTENLLLKENYIRYASLTRREKELLKHIASGRTAKETSAKMHISEKTTNTHRRNIKRKLGTKSHYELIRLAQAFNLI